MANMHSRRLVTYTGAHVRAKSRTRRSGRVQKRSAMARPAGHVTKHRYKTRLCGSKRIRIANLASHGETSQPSSSTAKGSDHRGGKVEPTEVMMDRETKRIVGERTGSQEVRHLVWKYDMCNDSDSKHESHDRRGNVNDELATSRSADNSGPKNERWNGPRWQERGSAPSREPGDDNHRYSGDSLFNGCSSRQVPAGLIKKASGGDGDDGDDGEERQGRGSGGDGSDGGAGAFSKTAPDDRKSPSVLTLPSIFDLKLAYAFAKALFVHRWSAIQPDEATR